MVSRLHKGSARLCRTLDHATSHCVLGQYQHADETTRAVRLDGGDRRGDGLYIF